MATSYNIDNFTPGAVPGWVKKDVAVLIAQAVGVGWTFLVKADSTATLIAPEPNKQQTIHLSSRRNSGPLRRLGAKVMKYADPNMLEAITTPEVEVLIGGPELTSEQLEKLEPAVEWTEPDAEERVLLRSGPMISRTGKVGNDTEYESDIAIQHEFSDGTIEYECVRCQFKGKVPKSMASHWKKHVHEDAELAKHELPPATPVDSLAAALVKRMEQGLDWVDLHAAAHELAVAATEWGLKRVEPEPVVVASKDTELIAQIRELLGVEDLSAEVEALRRENRVLKITAEAEAADAENARETLRTFRDLLNAEAS